MRPDGDDVLGGKSRRTGRKIAVVAGSGLGGIGEFFRTESTVLFKDIKGVGKCTVGGHRGEVHFCRVGLQDGRGTKAKEFVLVLGRRHVYEGGSYGMGYLISWLAGAGVTDLVVISAAGGLKKVFPPGQLVSVCDIIDLQNFQRLQRTAAPGFNKPEDPGHQVARERGMPDNRHGLSRRLTAAVESAAKEAGRPLKRGTLACCSGPSYETPSEVRFLLELGADLATMSSAPEVVFGGLAGMEVAVIGAVTNPGTGVGLERLDHSGIIDTASGMTGDLSRVIMQLIKNS